MIDALLGLIYPELCVVCRRSLLKFEQHICLTCLAQLPYTRFHEVSNNPVEKNFWGRIIFERAFAFLYFNKKGVTQKILHHLKYNNNKELAMYLGNLYGEQLKNTVINLGIKAVVAVPLHIKKLRQRGYNQSEWFANGLCESLNVENLSKCLMRVVATDTQTRKSRIQRWQNVENIFEITNSAPLKSKHILLVDDVITTGATIEACVSALQQIDDIKISIASIAYAN